MTSSWHVFFVISSSAKTAGSPLWPMPLFSDYKKLNESKLADISNLPTVRLGGSIHAALFLREFIKNVSNEEPFIRCVSVVLDHVLCSSLDAMGTH